MHIAICDDNVADRKQLERLLGRESDARKAMTGVFYIDSYGNSEGVYSKRMIYDIFFIDTTMSGLNGYELANVLIEGGVTTPIILCPSKIDYRSLFEANENKAENILFLDKPVLKAELSAILDRAVVIEASKEPTVELRSESGTYYLPEDDIVCCEQTSRYIDITLSDGKVVSILDSIPNLYSHISMYSHFAAISNRAIINAVYIDKISPLSVSLSNGKKFNIGLKAVSELKKVRGLILDENKKGEEQ